MIRWFGFQADVGKAILTISRTVVVTPFGGHHVIIRVSCCSISHMAFHVVAGKPQSRFGVDIAQTQFFWFALLDARYSVGHFAVINSNAAQR